MTPPEPVVTDAPIPVGRLVAVVVGLLIGASIARTEAAAPWKWPRDRFRLQEFRLKEASRVIPFVTVGAVIGSVAGACVYCTRRSILKLVSMFTRAEKIAMIFLIVVVALLSGSYSWFSVPWKVR